MDEVNLSGFCEVQKMVWQNYTKGISNLSCKGCGEKQLLMTHKWRCKCQKCGTNHTIKKPKSFPKNMDNERNWKATCSECGGKMDFRRGGCFGAYVCRKCSNILEV